MTSPLVVVNIEQSADLAGVLSALDQIRQQQEQIMASIDDVQAHEQAVSDSLDALSGDVNRLITDFNDLKSQLGTVPPDVQAKIDAVDASLSSLADRVATTDTAIDTADPEPTPQP